MRLLFASAAFAIASAAACASSEEQPTPTDDAGDPDPHDAATGRDTSTPDAPGDATCSEAGWCTTSLPDADLALKDVWPLSRDGAEYAFAIAESPTLGIKVLLWDQAGWKYIDDGTQNEPGYGSYASTIWAPSENEVYYGVAPATIYHGRRPDADGSWSWERQALADHSPDDPNAGGTPHDHGRPNAGGDFGGTKTLAFGVWGTGADDVYAWYANTIYHWGPNDAGAAAWVPEYMAGDARPNPSDPSTIEHLYILGATGTNRDDVWFAATRERSSFYSCTVVVRKTAKGYVRIADGVLPEWSFMPCEEQPGMLLIQGGNGWLTDIQATGKDRIVGLEGGREIMRLEAERDPYTVSLSRVPEEVGGPTADRWLSLWGPSDDELWLSGLGIVLRGSDVWNDGGAYQVSTISLNGGPTARPIYRVRGTADGHNLWAVGGRYALHKTNP